MSSFSTPRLILPRYVDGDIYGFSVMLDSDPDGVDSAFPVHPFWDNADSAGGYTGGHIVRENTQGLMVGMGAVGKSPDGTNPWHNSPFGCQDIQPDSQGVPKRPTWNLYQWYDPVDNRIKGSNQNTLSAAYHEGYFINQNGKLRNINTKYTTKPAMPRMFSDDGPRRRNGADSRLFEIWQDDPLSFGFDGSIVLKHICVAADECVMTLDTQGTIRIVMSGTSGVDLTEMGLDDDWQVVYFNKEDLEDHFWIDETGNPVQLDNVDFVDCWASGGGTSAQGITVWALKSDGTLYFQSMHYMTWLDTEYWLYTGLNNDGETITPRVQEKGKYRSEPFMIQRMIDDGETIEPGGEFILNVYHGARIEGVHLNRDVNGYLSDRGLRASHSTHGVGVEEFLGFNVAPNFIATDGVNITTGWTYEAGKSALNRIPKNDANKRYKVLSLCDGYGHGGACLCVDPDDDILDPGDGTGDPNVMVEPVFLYSWSPSVHRHLDETLHKIKRKRVIRLNANRWSYEDNIGFGDFSFDQTLYDLLFKNNETGRYIAPRRFASTRRNFTIMTNTGMVASIQGWAADGEIDPNPAKQETGLAQPLMNYEIDPTSSGPPPRNAFKLILDRNGSNITQGNWMHNYDAGNATSVDAKGDPIEPEDNTFDAFQNAPAVIINWFTTDVGDPLTPKPPPDRGPHRIFGINGLMEQSGRFGLGHMPIRPDKTIPGISSKAAYDLSSIAGIAGPAWKISYFPWVKEMGYDYEDHYWNHDSLVWLEPLPDAEGRDPILDPDYHKGSSVIHVWHAGPGSPHEPFATDPVEWWAGQGDNINVVFKSGKVDSTSYYPSEMSSAVMPTVSLPVIDLFGDEDDDFDDDPLDDPSPPLGAFDVFEDTQDSESDPGSVGTGENPEDPGCFDGVDGRDDDFQVGGPREDVVIP